MIKYLDLQKINASFEPELSDALLRVSHSGWYLHGEATARFEEEFAAYCGTSYCVGTGNGFGCSYFDISGLPGTGRDECRR